MWPAVVGPVVGSLISMEPPEGMRRAGVEVAGPCPARCFSPYDQLASLYDGEVNGGF